MARRPDNRNATESQAPRVIWVDGPSADLAYEAHRALQMTACSHPALLENPYFKALQDTAYARFLAAFKVA